MALIFITLIALIAAVPNVLSNGDGAPKEACNDMTPQHGPSPQSNNKSPYTVSWKSGENPGTFDVTITSKSTRFPVKGFLLKALDASEHTVGTWKIDAGETTYQTLSCTDDGVQNALTHTRKNVNTPVMEKTFTWIQPENLKGEIVFKATVVARGPVFWVAIPSAAVQLN